MASFNSRDHHSPTWLSEVIDRSEVNPGIASTESNASLPLLAFKGTCVFMGLWMKESINQNKEGCERFQITANIVSPDCKSLVLGSLPAAS
jgi:hypothetical protein